MSKRVKNREARAAAMAAWNRRTAAEGFCVDEDGGGLRLEGRPFSELPQGEEGASEVTEQLDGVNVSGGSQSPYYEDDACTIYHGDCFDILHNLSGVGAVITDPPYSSGGAFRGDRAQQTSVKYVNSDTAAYRPEFAGDNRDQRSFLAWCSMWLNAARQASEPGAVLASFIDWRQLPTLTDAVQCGGWIWRDAAADRAPSRECDTR